MILHRHIQHLIFYPHIWINLIKIIAKKVENNMVWQTIYTFEYQKIQIEKSDPFLSFFSFFYLGLKERLKFMFPMSWGPHVKWDMSLSEWQKKE